MDGYEVPGSNAVKGLHSGGRILHAQEGSPAGVDGEKAIALQACCGQQAESGTEVQKAWPGPSALGTIGEQDSSEEDTGAVEDRGTLERILQTSAGRDALVRRCCAGVAPQDRQGFIDELQRVAGPSPKIA